MVAQLVEQRTENPRVVGSIPTLATIINPFSFNKLYKPLLYQLSNTAVILAVIRVAPEFEQPLYPIAIYPGEMGEDGASSGVPVKRSPLIRTKVEMTVQKVVALEQVGV